VRPSNVVFIGFTFILNAQNRTPIQQRVSRVLKVNIIGAILAVFFITLIPQFIYWKYAYGSFFTYSYSNEGFEWLRPRLLFTWFSPNNGLFLYTPFFFLVLVGIILMISKKRYEGNYLLILFLLISYVFSSWWDRSFGCSFGARNYVEYLAIFALPIAFLYKTINQQSNLKKFMFYFAVSALIALNLKMTYTYDTCFPGNGDWDWNAYLDLIFSPPK
jgi:hypothetical protein